MRLIFSFCVFFFAFYVHTVCAEGLNAIDKAIDWSCINTTILGPCFKPTPPYIGVKVRYWEPALLVETVKKPGDSTIDEFGKVIGPIVSNLSKDLFQNFVGLSIPLTSGSLSNVTDNTNLKFNEVHVYSFPFTNEFDSLTAYDCPGGQDIGGGIKYLSELDAVEWRIGLFEALNPKAVLSASLGPICAFTSGKSQGLCMGSWGPVYPRRGFFTHQSEVVGSAADVFRAVSIASIEGFSSHIVNSPIGFIPDPDMDKLQLIFPFPSGCIRIGENPFLWESNKTSVDGKYAWVYWRHRECCIW